MSLDSNGTEALLEGAARGDEQAREVLFARHRGPLRRMVALRLDRRGAIDPSDVVQEALGDAARKLADYLQKRPLPFYPWLYSLTRERLIRVHRRRGLPMAAGLSECLVASTSGVGARLEREEQLRRMRAVLEEMGERDREVLVMRHMDGLKSREIAAILGLTEAAVKVRHFRAMTRIREKLGLDAEGREVG